MTTKKKDSAITDDQIDDVVRALGYLDRAITPRGSDSVLISGGNDATGGYVTSLTEAVMGITAGLCKIADAIDGLSAAVDRRGDEK